MNTNLARRITQLVNDIDTLDEDMEDTVLNSQEVLVSIAQRILYRKRQLAALLVQAQRQELLERARQIAQESYR